MSILFTVSVYGWSAALNSEDDSDLISATFGFASCYLQALFPAIFGPEHIYFYSDE